MLNYKKYTFHYRIGLSTFKSSREETYSDFARSYDQNICQKSENCGESRPDIRCSTCWKHITSQNVTFLNNMTTPNAKSAHNMNIFGQENILVQEFVNPHDYHFQSIQVKNYYLLLFLLMKNNHYYDYEHFMYKYLHIQVLETSGVKAQENEKWHSGDTWFPGM